TPTKPSSSKTSRIDTKTRTWRKSIPGIPGQPRWRSGNKVDLAHVPITHTMRRSTMNAFVRHHSSSIRFAYSCFDRMVCNAYIQPFLYVPSLCRFLIHSRQVAPIKPASLRKISADYHEQLGEQIRQLGAAIVEPPARVRREEWLESFYQELGTRDGIAV